MTGLLVGLCCFALHAVVTLTWLRLPGRVSPVARHAASALGTHVLVFALAAYVVGPFAYWPAAAVSGFLAVCWLFAFSAVYKSVSLRILAQLNCEPGHSLSLEAITEDYVRPEFDSIAVLVRVKCVKEKEAGFAATVKGAETACRIQAIRRVCGVQGDGMYGDLASRERKRPEEASPVAYAPGSPRTLTPPSP